MIARHATTSRLFHMTPEINIPGRLMIVTGLWPTADSPLTGTFVRDRVSRLAQSLVVAPSHYRTPRIWRYLSLWWRAITAAGPVLGVEAHGVFPTGLLAL